MKIPAAAAAMILFLAFPVLGSGAPDANVGGVNVAGANVDGAKESVYTPKVVELMKDWPPAGLPVLPAAGAGAPFWIEAIRTPGNSSYIGLRKRVFIHAPLSRVSSVFEDFENYSNVFPGVEKVKVLERGDHRIATDWTRDRVVFFMPKIRYEQIYFESDANTARMYRYQLKSGNSVNYADGVVVLEPAPDGTYVSSYDFFEGNFGFAKFFAESKIWHDTLVGYAQADCSLKLKAENPSWSKNQIEAAAESLIRRFPIRMDQVRFSDGSDVGIR